MASKIAHRDGQLNLIFFKIATDIAQTVIMVNGTAQGHYCKKTARVLKSMMQRQDR